MVKPLYDKIVAKKVSIGEKVVNGIVLPAPTDELPWMEGVVEEVGSGRIISDGTIIPLKVKKGDKVCWPKHAGFPFDEGSVSYVILREDELFGIQE
jgi:chaperonin GroES